ncbi:hypothetical protein SEA_ORCANUS_59 [Arthrobacter phage Orcanus]|nr:hypothetical protein SEA_ORCANUS_59 [Arthrobacter phage Orcanus]
MRCRHCGRRIMPGPLRSLAWVHLTDLGVAGAQKCRLQDVGNALFGSLMAEPTEEGK